MWSWKLGRCFLDKTINTTSKLPQWGFLMSSRSIQSDEVPTKIRPSTMVTKKPPSTIDVPDVELFSKYVKEWWDPEGIMAPLHNMNIIRIPFIRDGLISTAQKDLYPLKGKKILDVGCGGGILSEGLARLGACVTGIDPSEDLIRVAEKHKHIDPKIEMNKPYYINCTIEEHVENASNLYDGVVASEVIEHVQNQELFVKSCVKAVKPRGKLFFTTPNRTLLCQFLFIFLTENVVKSIPKGAHQSEKFITPNELKNLLEKNNCHVELTYGVTYNPLSGKWNFVQYQNLMYAIQATKLS